MSEVCILHAADSEPFARKVAAQLAADGYSVVRRDAGAPKGGERRLSDAVIVVWSDAMLAAAQTIDAARRALARRILVPVAVGDVAPPASFAHLMPIDLKDWSGDIDDPRWQFVREEVDLARRRGELSRETAPEPSARAKKRARGPMKAAMMIAGAGALGAAAAVSVVAVAGLLPGFFPQDTDKRPARAPTAELRPQTDIRSDEIATAAYAALPLAAAPQAAPEFTPEAAPEAAPETARAPIEIPPPPILAHMTVIEPSPAESPEDRFDPPADDGAAALAETVAEEIAAAPPPVDLSKLPRPVADDFSGAVFRDCAQCPDMAEIPAGIPGAAAIDRPFAMSRREIRFSDWEACVADGGCAGSPSDAGWGRGARPVIGVSFADAERYVAWLSEKTGRRYRLPTGAEWRYAAQNPPSGANLAGALDAAGPGLRMTVPTGSFASSVLGLYDMRGNVAEWTADCGDGASPPCASRLVAGGSFATAQNEAASASGVPAAARRPDIGFRVVRDLP